MEVVIVPDLRCHVTGFYHRIAQGLYWAISPYPGLSQNLCMDCGEFIYKDYGSDSAFGFSLTYVIEEHP